MAINWDDIAKQAIQKEGGKVAPTTSSTTQTSSQEYKRTSGITDAPVDYTKRKQTTQKSGINWDDISKQAIEKEKNKPKTPTYLEVEKPKKSSILSKVAQAAKETVKAKFPTTSRMVESFLIAKKRGDEKKANPIVGFGEGEQFQITEEDVKRNPNLKPVYDAMQRESTTKAGPTIRTSELAKKDIYPKMIPATAPASEEQLSLKDTASLTIKTSAPAQVLSDAPITTKIKSGASKILNDTVTTLRAAEQQFKSGPRGKLEVTKGAAKGIFEAGLDIAKFSAKTSAYNDFNPVTRKLKQEAYQKAYDVLDAQVQKIRPKEGYEQVFTVGKFVGDQVPYVVSDALFIKAFKSLPIALQTKRLVQESVEATSWVATGQILHRPEDGSRLDKALIDASFYLGFRTLGLSGLGLKGVVEEQLSKQTLSSLKNKLSQTSQEIITKLENGENVLIDEIEHVVKEVKNIDDNGVLKVGDKEVKTNSQSQLQNFVVNERKTQYSVNTKATEPTVTFPSTTSAGVRISASTIEEVVALAEKFGQRFSTQTQRNIFEVFSTLMGKNFNIDEIIQGLTSYSVQKAGGTINFAGAEKIVNEFVESIPNEIQAILKSPTGIGRGLSGIPERAWKQIVKEALDGNLEDIAPNLSSFIRDSAKRYDLDVKVKELPKPKEFDKVKIKEMGVKAPTVRALKQEVTETIDDSLVKQEKKKVEGGVSQKEIEPVKQDIKGKPEKKSRLYQRMQDDIETEFRNDGISYTQMDLEENARKAIEVVNSRSSKEILDVVRGMAPSIEGVTDSRLGIALFHKAIEEGNSALAAEAIQSTARRATRSGQEIVALRGAFGKNTEQSIIKDVLAKRIEKAKSKLRKMGDVISKKSSEGDIIISESKALKADIDKKVSKLIKAQAILDKLTCK